MILNLLMKISAISTIFQIHRGSAYEFHANNITFLQNIVKEVIASDSYETKPDYDIQPISNISQYVLIILKKNNTDKEARDEGPLKDALRMRHPSYQANKLARKEKVKKDYLKLHEAERARKENAARVKEIEAFMKYSYKATEYLYSEVQRILRDRVILDGPRQIVADVEGSQNATFIRAMKKCVYKAMAKHGYDDWDAEPNKLTLNFVKDAYNDGVD